MKRSVLPILLIALGALGCLLAAPFFGVTLSPLSAALDPFGAGMEAVVFWRIRVPRVLTAFLAGAGLGVCGMAFQALFRNPLATPYTLGVSSGIALAMAFFQARLSAVFAALRLGLCVHRLELLRGRRAASGLARGLRRGARHRVHFLRLPAPRHPLRFAVSLVPRISCRHRRPSPRFRIAPQLRMRQAQ